MKRGQCPFLPNLKAVLKVALAGESSVSETSGYGTSNAELRVVPLFRLMWVTYLLWGSTVRETVKGVDTLIIWKWGPLSHCITVGTFILNKTSINSKTHESYDTDSQEAFLNVFYFMLYSGSNYFPLCPFHLVHPQEAFY